MLGVLFPVNDSSFHSPYQTNEVFGKDPFLLFRQSYLKNQFIPIVFLAQHLDTCKRYKGNDQFGAANSGKQQFSASTVRPAT